MLASWGWPFDVGVWKPALLDARHSLVSNAADGRQNAGCPGITISALTTADQFALAKE